MPELRERLQGWHQVGEAETREDAPKQVEAMTEDSYLCFAVDDDGTCIDLTGTFPGCLAGVVK